MIKGFLVVQSLSRFKALASDKKNHIPQKADLGEIFEEVGVGCSSEGSRSVFPLLVKSQKYPLAEVQWPFKGILLDAVPQRRRWSAPPG